MANSSIPEGLANQVSSESLDTFLLNLSATSDLEDLAMDQPFLEGDDSKTSRHANVKQPSTMPFAPTADTSTHENTVNDATATSNANGTGTNGIVPNSNASQAAKTVDRAQPSSSTTTANAVSAARAISGTVPEFLYQLFQMLTDNNREVIEWDDGKSQVPRCILC